MATYKVTSIKVYSGETIEKENLIGSYDGNRRNCDDTKLLCPDYNGQDIIITPNRFIESSFSATCIIKYTANGYDCGTDLIRTVEINKSTIDCSKSAYISANGYAVTEPYIWDYDDNSEVVFTLNGSNEYCVLHMTNAEVSTTRKTRGNISCFNWDFNETNQEVIVSTTETADTVDNYYLNITYHINEDTEDNFISVKLKKIGTMDCTNINATYSPIEGLSWGSGNVNDKKITLNTTKGGCLAVVTAVTINNDPENIFNKSYNNNEITVTPTSDTTVNATMNVEYTIGGDSRRAITNIPLKKQGTSPAPPNPCEDGTASLDPETGVWKSDDTRSVVCAFTLTSSVATCDPKLTRIGEYPNPSKFYVTCTPGEKVVSAWTTIDTCVDDITSGFTVYYKMYDDGDEKNTTLTLTKKGTTPTVCNDAELNRDSYEWSEISAAPIDFTLSTNDEDCPPNITSVIISNTDAFGETHISSAVTVTPTNATFPSTSSATMTIKYEINSQSKQDKTVNLVKRGSSIDCRDAEAKLYPTSSATWESDDQTTVCAFTVSGTEVCYPTITSITPNDFTLFDVKYENKPSEQKSIVTASAVTSCASDTTSGYTIHYTMLDDRQGEIELKLNKEGTDYKQQYLTLVAKDSGHFEFEVTNSQNYSYSKNGEEWTNADSSTKIYVSDGDKVRFKGNLTPSGSDGIGRFYSTTRVEAKGNVMSLLFGENFGNKTSLAVYDYAFANLFAICPRLESIVNLNLPATTLSSHCYKNMFAVDNSGSYWYTFLTEIPENLLPATTLAEHCYEAMFNNCSGLTSLPNLPARTLAPYCYHGMFDGCTSLTAIPDNLLQATTLAESCYQSMFSNCGRLNLSSNNNLLPATTLAANCYQSMFSNCVSLNLPSNNNLLPATTLANECYRAMFARCTSLTIPPKLNASTVKYACYAGMFEGCTGLTTVPSNMLPSTNLDSWCYRRMFAECSSLQKAPKLPAALLKPACYQEMFDECGSLNEVWCGATGDTTSKTYTSVWLENVAEGGTFHYNSLVGDISYWTRDESGIPMSWIPIKDYNPLSS